MLFAAPLAAVFNLIVDLVYPLLDPRVQELALDGEQLARERVQRLAAVRGDEDGVLDVDRRAAGEEAPRGRS